MKRKIISLIVLVFILSLLVVKNYINLYKEDVVEAFEDDITSIGIHKEEVNKQELSIINEMPLDDIQGSQKDPYTFKIKNNFDYEVRYNIYLIEDKEIEQLDNCINNLIDYNYIKYSVNEKIDNVLNASLNNNIIYTKILKPYEEEELNIRIWIDKTKSINMDTTNKHIHFKIISNIIENNIKLIDHLKNKSSKKTKYYIDTDEAKEMYKISNDYRYIGNIPNNYIYFNCKNDTLSSCEIWRIVSIEKTLLNTLNKEYRIKLVSENLQDKTSYENIKYEINNTHIEEVILKRDTLFKQTNFGLLTIDDYRKSYANGVNERCYTNILKCNKNSYLTLGEKEWLNIDEDYYTYISTNGNVVKTNNTTNNQFRPIVYLKKNIILLGGNGSKEMPYFIY
ncbi:MAG: hypothetical protein IKO49_05720 [Bacilli bacterium]|nr:hypothetical protein [Bacilli bacterium]